MTRRVVVIGAGMGGLAAAIRLARLGFRARVIEARADAGGLAAGFSAGGFPFDAGPYILLDRPGLEWAFRTLGLELSEQVALRRVEDVYEVSSGGGPTVRIHADLDATAAGLERAWPGSGRRYASFVASMARIYDRLEPLLHASRPGLAQLVRARAWRHVPFLLRSLRSVLAGAGLPEAAADAVAIWTHVAGQEVGAAPSPMALVPALIHRVGAFYPVGGVAAVPRALARAAVAAGVEFRYRTKVLAIRTERGRACGVETDAGEFVPADAVVSNASGVGTYLELTAAVPPRARRRLQSLPLQSPGACAYLAVKGPARPPYLRFRRPGAGEACRLLVLPGAVAPESARDGWWPARLLAPMDHASAEHGGPAGASREHLERLLAERWWRDEFAEVRVLATRVPDDWGAEYHLYRSSMNPVMTARFMRAGRLAHRSPYVRGLYLAGASTHPGQWVSFCAISGTLAAERVREDLS